MVSGNVELVLGGIVVVVVVFVVVVVAVAVVVVVVPVVVVSVSVVPVVVVPVTIPIEKVCPKQQLLMTKADSTAAVLQSEMALEQSDFKETAKVFSLFKSQSITWSTSNMFISSRQRQPSSAEEREHSFIFAAKLTATR